MKTKQKQKRNKYLKYIVKKKCHSVNGCRLSVFKPTKEEKEKQTKLLKKPPQKKQKKKRKRKRKSINRISYTCTQRIKDTGVLYMYVESKVDFQ